MSTAIQSVMQENRIFPPPAAFSKDAAVSEHGGVQARSPSRPRTTTKASGRKLAREHISWHKPFTQVLNEAKPPFYKWFEDGELNVSYNCLDRQVEAGHGDKVAIIFEADNGQVTQVTYKELLRARLPARERAQGQGRSEGRPGRHLHADDNRRSRRDAGVRSHRRDALGRVRRLFGAVAAATAFIDAGAVMLITADGQFRGGKALAAESRLPTKRSRRTAAVAARTFWWSSAPAATSTWWRGRDEWVHDAIKDQADHLRSRSGSARSIRCSCSTPPARPASRRACSTPPAAIC